MGSNPTRVISSFLFVFLQKYEAESDDGSDTDSELMFQDLPKVGEKTSKGKVRGELLLLFHIYYYQSDG